MNPTSTRRRMLAMIPAALAAPLARATTLQEVKVALSWLRDGEFSALMVADLKGYFAEDGLKVTLIDGGAGRNPITTVGAGQADFGMAPGSDVFRARLAPSPVDVQALGAVTQRMPLAYITLGRPSDPDPTPRDMEGKTVGIQAPGRFFLEALLKRNGVDPAKVKTQVVLANAEPLLFGKVDYFTGFLTNQTWQIEQAAARPDAPPSLKGKTWKAIPFHQYGVAMPVNVVVATGKTVRERPELVRKFLRALARGLKFEHENLAEAVRLAAGYPGQLDSADKLAWRLKIKQPLELSDGTRTHGLLWTDSKAWTETMTFFKDAGEIPRVLPVDEVVNNSFNPGIRLAR
jgi:NitT/TauT family transport system substrate-binding protein